MARLTIMDANAAIDAGRGDATDLIGQLCNLVSTTSAENLFVESLGKIIALAIENRSAEASARLTGYAALIAPMLAEASARLIGYAALIAPMLAAACDTSPENGEEVARLQERISALETKCALYAASLAAADREMIEINRRAGRAV